MKANQQHMTSRSSCDVVRLSSVVSSALTSSIPLSLAMSLSTMFLDWQSHFHVSRAETVSVHSTCMGVFFTAAVIPGHLMDRYGARSTVVMGTALSTVGLFLSAFATSVPHLIVTTGVVGGMGFSMTYLPCVPCATSGVEEGRSLIIAVISTYNGMFSMSLPYLLRYIIDVFGWRGAYFILSAISLNTLVTGLVMTSPLRMTSGFKNNGESEIGELDTFGKKDVPGDLGKPSNIITVFHITGTQLDASDESGASQVRDLSCEPNKTERLLLKWRFMADPVFLAYLASIVMGLAVMVSFSFFFADFANVLGLNGKEYGVFFLSITFMSSVLSRLAVGVVNYMYPAFHSLAILSLSSGLGACLMLSLAHVTPMTSYTLLVAVFVLFGLAMGGFLGICQKVPLDLESVRQDTYSLALGVATSAEGIAYVSLPSLIGYAVDQSGSYFLPLSVMGSAALLASAMLAVAAWRTVGHSRRGVTHHFTQAVMESGRRAALPEREAVQLNTARGRS